MQMLKEGFASNSCPGLQVLALFPVAECGDGRLQPKGGIPLVGGRPTGRGFGAILAGVAHLGGSQPQKEEQRGTTGGATPTRETGEQRGKGESSGSASRSDPQGGPSSGAPAYAEEAPLSRGKVGRNQSRSQWIPAQGERASKG